MHPKRQLSASNQTRVTYIKKKKNPERNAAAAVKGRRQLMTAGGQGTGAAAPTLVFGSPRGGESHGGGVGTPHQYPEVSPTLRTSLCPLNNSPLCSMGTGTIWSQVFLPKSKGKFCLILPPDVTSREHPNPPDLLPLSLCCLECDCVSAFTRHCPADTCGLCCWVEGGGGLGKGFPAVQGVVTGLGRI